MVSVLLVVGLLVAVFVGFNIGGSSTGVAFGPAVGSKTISKIVAAGLMSGFFLLGGATLGTEVIETMGGDIVPAEMFTLATSVGVLFFVGFALLISNLFGVPASTSMTAVGAIAGLGVATGTIDWSVMGQIVSWWLFAPVLAFWVCAVIGRYFYPYIQQWFPLEGARGSPVVIDRSGAIPLPRKRPGTGNKEVLAGFLVVGIACYMAFSAGASNAANAVAPLVGSGRLGLYPGVFLASGAVALGAFTIARRTLDTVGNDLTDLPILAALIVESVSATIITALSWMGIPASLAVSATMCIVGLGWGRATRTTTISDAASAAVKGESATEMSVDVLAADEAEAMDEGTSVSKIGEEEQTEITAADLFDPAATGRVVMLWILTPTLSGVASYLLFRFAPVF
ncbi:inorganic phosphate transporter [Halorientalis regularis]|jgi:PiT family inorganic phosphate transporter|uniref:Phosphate transporter n=1 Tax=Halorientalis regularis TaxID=660518 RepID=A0A1G7GFM4_9EURY|nr:inorganic phosphate transporter [Halorientalis regularis]SDE86952.1 inorganic phosphate transporter, PiT family [Halorientalis regularis]